ncbi:MAG: 30S ribosomal protein S9 [Myxococcota bacterium]|jgi:small subunit ribosomal protein S9|nr:30S ribosomal protein S9 [Pseudomonadota bacterium]MDP2304569.1 30S ribosomal protein S9 [Pseudomonadota bacterium]
MRNAPVQYYATGRRKTAAARVFLRPGTGAIKVNARDIEVYFERATAKMIVRQPALLIGAPDRYDVFVTVAGGGKSGQAEAIRMGIARALCVANPTDRTELKRAGFLRRDDRMVERKKYGRPGARKRFQFSKR